jgi:hypothetical protein
MITPAEKFLSCVEGVRQTAPGRWVFKVPTRKDKRASGSARELSDGRLLIHDFGGDSVIDILAAVDLEMTDLYPEQLTGHGKPERRPFVATDALRCVAFEALVVAAAGASLLAGTPFTPDDRERLILAVSRIQESMATAGVLYV